MRPYSTRVAVGLGLMLLLAGCADRPASDPAGPSVGSDFESPLDDYPELWGTEGIPVTMDYVVTNVTIFLPPSDPAYPDKCRALDGSDEGFVVGNINNDHGVLWFGRARGPGFEFSGPSSDCVDIRDLTLHEGLSVLTFPRLGNSTLNVAYQGRVTGGMPGSFTLEATGTFQGGTGLMRCATGSVTFTGAQNGDGTSSYQVSGHLRLRCRGWGRHPQQWGTH